jgi:hypothetical protein
MTVKRKRLSARDGNVAIIETTEEALNRPDPPGPTSAELAATLSLRASAFWVGLQRALVAKGAMTLQDDVQAHVLVTIEAAEAGEAIDAETAMEARIRVRTAGDFLRNDPELPGLLDGIGALLGLSPSDIDDVFLRAAGLAPPEPA